MNNNIVIKANITNSDKQTVINWTNSYNQIFLNQWAGANLNFPLTLEEFNFQNIYSIFSNEEFIGIIQKIREENNNIHIGRFLINPLLTGKGLGKIALTEFINFIFQNKNIHSITLNVFTYNINAIKLYKKLGFEILEIVTQPEKKYLMIKFR